MRIVGFDPFVSNEQGRHVGVGLFPFEEVLRQADFLTLHVPLTDATRRLIGADELGKMKQGSFLVNCARGGLVDEEALHQSLQAGDLAGRRSTSSRKSPLVRIRCSSSQTSS